jgi:hypothetical protein
MKYPGLLSAALLLAIAVWEIARLLSVHAAAAPDDDWKAARAAVGRDFQKGDLIVFAPDWVDPLGRKWLGDLMTIEDAARMDDARYGRVWEVSIRGAAAPEAAGRRVAAETQLGRVRVRRLEREPAKVVWDLRGRAQLLEVDYHARGCAEVRAPGKLDAGTVALGARLAARAGLIDFRNRRDNFAFALVRVLVDDQEVARASIGSESGWVALPEAATAPGPHHVVFDVGVDPARGGKPAVLDVCLAAEARQ